MVITGFDWRNIQDKVEEIFGSDAWNQINEMIPRRGPAVDGYTMNNEIIITVETPGLSTSDRINIKLRGYRLIVQGIIPYPVLNDGDMYIRKERFSGDFIREIELPHDIAPDGKIKAFYKNGILEIHVPRISSEDDKDIQVDFDE
jgi:HSP20 family protein